MESNHPTSEATTPLHSRTPKTLPDKEMLDLLLTPERLSSKKRPELQRYCKRFGIKANIKNKEMVESLREYAMSISDGTLQHEESSGQLEDVDVIMGNEGQCAAESVNQTYADPDIEARYMPIAPPPTPMPQISSVDSQAKLIENSDIILANAQEPLYLERNSQQSINIPNDQSDFKTLKGYDESFKTDGGDEFYEDIDSTAASHPLKGPRISSFMARIFATPNRRSSSQGFKKSSLGLSFAVQSQLNEASRSFDDARNSDNQNISLEKSSNEKDLSQLPQSTPGTTQKVDVLISPEEANPTKYEDQVVFDSNMSMETDALVAVKAELERRVAEIQKLPSPEIKKYIGEIGEVESTRLATISLGREYSPQSTPNRFDKLHKRQFDKMPSIVDHYISTRRKADDIGDDREESPIKKKKLDHASNDHECSRNTKPIYKHNINAKSINAKKKPSMHQRPVISKIPVKPRITTLAKSDITSQPSTFHRELDIKKRMTYKQKIREFEKRKEGAKSVPQPALEKPRLLINLKPDDKGGVFEDNNVKATQEVLRTQSKNLSTQKTQGKFIQRPPRNWTSKTSMLPTRKEVRSLADGPENLSNEEVNGEKKATVTSSKLRHPKNIKDDLVPKPQRLNSTRLFAPSLHQKASDPGIKKAKK